MAATEASNVPESLCACEGDRFVVTIAVTCEGVTEHGPATLCCAMHLSAAEVLADILREREPEMEIKFDVHPIEKV